MSRDRTGTVEGESFLRRFSRRKHEARLGKLEDGENTEEMQLKTVVASEPPEQVETAPPGDDDMPPLDSLTADSDYSAFFSPRVSESLRREALRQLWQTGDFGVSDGLDIYAADYTGFEGLGSLVTAEMRHRIELEVRRQAEALAEVPGEPDVLATGTTADKTARCRSDESTGRQAQAVDKAGEEDVEKDV